ncbi:E3 ubiquitin-protein ligase BIG BROTHER [Bienertia sinuspersici]
MGSQLWEEHHVPPELKENLTELYPDLTFEEAVQHQESLYLSLKVGYVDQSARSSDNEPSSSHGHSWGESSNSGSGDYDMALDEAVARSLQELDLEDEDGHVAVSESVRTSSRNTEPAAVENSVSDAQQDDVDLDRMTYEELQSLGESIGSENRGLSKTEIASLPHYKYKASFFSKKTNIGE